MLKIWLFISKSAGNVLGFRYWYDMFEKRS